MVCDYGCGRDMFLDRRCIAPHIGTKRRCVPIMTKNGDYEINFKINLKAHLLQFPLRVLVRMVMGTVGAAGVEFTFSFRNFFYFQWNS